MDVVGYLLGKKGQYNGQDMTSYLLGKNAGGGGILPAGYKQVQYIQSDGTQRIDTGISPNDNYYGFKAKFNIIQPTGDWNLMNMGGTSVDRNRFGFGGYFPETGTTQWQIGYIRGMNLNYCFAKVENPQTETYKDYEVEYNYNGNRICKLNGDVLVSSIPTGTNAVAYINHWNIFCQAYQSGSFSRFLKGRLYYMKIYLNETLLRDFIPCYRKSDNVVGLYDIENDVFYEKATGNNFIAGPSV